MFDILQQLFGQKQQPNMLAQQPQQGGNMLALPVGGSAQMPQAQPELPAQPGLMDRYKAFTGSDKGQTLNDLFTGWAMGSTPQQSIGLGAAQISKGRDARKSKEQQNQTVDWLKSKGMEDTQARAVASNPTVLADYLKNLTDPNSDLDAQLRQAQIDNMRSEIDKRNQPEHAQFGNSPIWGQDAQGKWVVMQPSSSGGIVPATTPDGIDLVPPGASNMNLGTSIATRDRAGNIISQQPVDNAGAAAQTKMGEAQGAAAFDLPRVEQNANMTLGVLKKMKAHPGREGSTGFIEGILPSRSSDQVDFQSLVDQTKGQTFLQAFQMLKGAGAITDIEGSKATDAISRLGNQRLSDADYLQAINDLEDVIKTGVARAQQQAGGGAAAPATPGAVPGDAPKRFKFDPATGTLK